MKTSALILIFVICFYSHLSAQFISATVGLNGLTCSACSNATEQSIRQLDFVEYVDMDLDNNLARVVFKKDRRVDIKKLSAKVYDAGFSVSSMDAVYRFEPSLIIHGNCLTLNQENYFIIDVKDTLFTGERIMTVIDKKMMSRTAFKAYKLVLKSQCNGREPDYYITFK